MALDGATLKSDLQNLMDGTTPTPTVTVAGNEWGQSYHDYALTGTANGISPTIAASSKTTLQSSLKSAFETLPGVPATVAAAISSALDVYWPTAVFAGQTAPPVPGGAAVLITSLTGIFNNVGGTHDSKSTEIRDALKTYTNAVIVTFPAGSFPVV